MPQALFAVTVPPPPPRPRSPPSKPRVTAFMPTIIVTQSTQRSIQPAASPPVVTTPQAKLSSPIWLARPPYPPLPPPNATSNPNLPWFIPTEPQTTSSTPGATPTGITPTAPTPPSSGPPLDKQHLLEQISGSQAGQRCKYLFIIYLYKKIAFLLFAL